MTLPQDKPHITAGETFKIKRKYDIFSCLSNIPGISSETLEILKKNENFKNNELKNLSPVSTDESDSQILCLSQNFLSISYRKAPKALKILKALIFP